MTEDDLLEYREEFGKRRKAQKPGRGWRPTGEERKELLSLQIQAHTAEYLARGGKIQHCTWRDNQNLRDSVLLSRKANLKRQKRLDSNNRLIALDKKAAISAVAGLFQSQGIL